jgi:hypothetical protein
VRSDVSPVEVVVDVLNSLRRDLLRHLDGADRLDEPPERTERVDDNGKRREEEETRSGNGCVR